MPEQRVTLAKSRRAKSVSATSGLAAEEVASWLTLQTITLAEPGVCTEVGMFYRAKGQVFVSALDGQILIEPRAALRFSTAFNMLALEALDRTCRLGRLAVALRGAGRVEVTILQGLAGRSSQQLVSDIVTLSPTREVVIELDAARLDRREGAIWIELRAIDGDGAQFDSGRFLTDSLPDPDLRLAICFSQGPEAKSRKVEHLLTWAAAQTVPVSVLTSGPAAVPGLLTVKAETSPKAALTAMLAEARARAFTHVLMLSDDTSVGLETLDRTLACLLLSRDQGVALGAGTLDAAEASQLESNGLTRNAEGKLTAVSALFNLTDLQNVLEVGFDAIADAGSALIVPQSTFLACALSALGDADCRIDPRPLRLQRGHLH